jgi:hypothetical protein
LTPADIAGDHAAGDLKVAALIAAAQADIDGPAGWLGRALGPQTLETTAVGFDRLAMRLPCPPVIDVLSIGYLDRAGVLQTVDADIWEFRDEQVWLKHGQRWPTARYCEGSVRITYVAGYDNIPVIDGGTGPLPAQVKLALQLTVQHAMSIGAENLFLRSEEVEGIGTTTYTISTVAADLIRGAVERYLGGLRLYA